KGTPSRTAAAGRGTRRRQGKRRPGHGNREKENRRRLSASVEVGRAHRQNVSARSRLFRRPLANGAAKRRARQISRSVRHGKPSARLDQFSQRRSPPEMKMVHAGEDPGDPPSDKHKEGVRLIVKMDESLGGEVRELLSTSWAMWTAIDALHDDYTAAV